MWLLMDSTQFSPVLRLLGPQGDPPNQPLPFNLFFPPLALPLKVIKIQGWVQIGAPGILHLGVVVFQVSARDLGTEAEVEGTARSSQGGQGEVVTLIQGTRVLPMYPLGGMEATQAMAGDRGMAKSAAQVVAYNMLAGSPPVLSAMQGFAKVILVRAVGSGTRLVIWVKKY